MAATVKNEKATVAHGRTVKGHNGKCFGPGAEIELSEDDVKALRASGFLVDPDAEVIARGFGPKYAADRGPTIKRG